MTSPLSRSLSSCFSPSFQPKKHAVFVSSSSLSMFSAHIHHGREGWIFSCFGKGGLESLVRFSSHPMSYWFYELGNKVHSIHLSGKQIIALPGNVETQARLAWVLSCALESMVKSSIPGVSERWEFARDQQGPRPWRISPEPELCHDLGVKPRKKWASLFTSFPPQIYRDIIYIQEMWPFQVFSSMRLYKWTQWTTLRIKDMDGTFTLFNCSLFLTNS